MLPALGLIAVGIVMLTVGADRLVLSAARIASRFGLSPILVGALVVGIGTSMPEFLVSVVAAARGTLDLAAGNIIGSNVANLSLVIGVAALLSPVSADVRTIRREGFITFGASLLFAAFAWNNALSAIEGLILLGSMAVVGWLLVQWARTDVEGSADLDAELAEMEADGRSMAAELVIGVVAIFATLAGAEVLVRGATRVASELGLSEGFIGLTLVAIGTSLPELATAVAAARRRENDLVVGNVLGSNIFNSLLVGGGAALAGAGPLTGDFRPSLLAMLAVTALSGLFARTGSRIVRWEGVTLLVAFGLVVASAA